MKISIRSLIIGFFAGVILMLLYTKFFSRSSFYETATMFDSATTSDEVQKMYDEAVASVINEVNTNIPAKNEGVDVSKIGEDLQLKIADISAAATKAFARVAPKTVTQAPSPAPEAPAPSPPQEPSPSPQTSTYEIEPYHG